MTTAPSSPYLSAPGGTGRHAPGQRVDQPADRPEAQVFIDDSADAELPTARDPLSALPRTVWP